MASPSLKSTCRYKACPCWYTGNPPTWLVYIALVVVQVGFGIYPGLVKKFAGEIKVDPLIFGLYRDVLCSPVLFLCAFIAERRILIPSLKMLMLFILLGLVGMFMNQIMFLLGVYWATPNVASAFQPVIPVWTTLLALATCTEKFPSPKKFVFWAKMIGIVLAAGGAIEVTLLRDKTTPHTTNVNTNSDDEITPLQQMLGYLALFGNTLSMACYILLQKRFIFDSPKNQWKEYPVQVTAYSYFFGSIFIALASLMYYNQPEKFYLPQQTLYALVYAVFITSALCYLLLTWSNMHISSIIVTASWPIQVLVAVLFSWLLVGDVLAPLQYIGSAMLIVGLFFVLWSNYKEKKDLANGNDYSIDLLEIIRKKMNKKPLGESSPLINRAGGSPPATPTEQKNA